LISSIRLAGEDDSYYRLNIDGELTNELYDIEIPAKDSIYIFVELTVDPNGSNQPMIVQDSIEFVTNSNLQDIDLLAWGQDFVPIDREIITTSTWTADKPYLIYEYAYIDSGEILTIEPGTQIYFHDDAGLYAKGAIKALGTIEQPIVFSGDRMEMIYDDIPDQWQGILLYPSEIINEFENVEIKNANIGLQVGTIENDGSAYARLHNVKIEHMSYAGIFAMKSQIEATNSVIADCGYYCVTLLIGGDYSFNHCTIANYWGSYSNRDTPSVIISNRLIVSSTDGSTEYIGDLTRSSWRNSIIWGNLSSEIEFASNEDALFNYQFENCLIRIADSIDTSDSDYYNSIITNTDPNFYQYSTYNYELDTLSPAKDIGSIIYGELVPMDLNNVSRLSDDAPDLGAYERIEETEDN
jgi:hypothetical protein